jgi:hypothetical protein
MTTFDYFKTFTQNKPELHFADVDDKAMQIDVVGHLKTESTGKVMEIDELCVEFRLLLQENTISVLARYQDTDTGEYLDHPINSSDETLLTELIDELKEDFLSSLPITLRNTVVFFPISQ